MDSSFFTGHRNCADQGWRLGSFDSSAMRRGCGCFNGSSSAVGLCVCGLEFNRESGLDGFISVRIGAVIELDYLDGPGDFNSLRSSYFAEAKRTQLIRFQLLVELKGSPLASLFGVQDLSATTYGPLQLQAALAISPKLRKNSPGYAPKLGSILIQRMELTCSKCCKPLVNRLRLSIRNIYRPVGNS